MQKKIRAALLYATSAAAGGIIVFLITVTAYPPQLDYYIKQTREYIVEHRAEQISSSTSTNWDDSLTTAEIRISSSCIGRLSPCTYSHVEHVIEISQGQGRAYMRRYFDKDLVPVQATENLPLTECALTSEVSTLSGPTTQKILKLLTLPNFWDFGSFSGVHRLHQNPTYLNLKLNDRHITVSDLTDEKSTPARISKVVQLVFLHTEGKVSVPEQWPIEKKCLQ